MKRYMPFMFVPFVALAACDSDDTSTTDTDATSQPDGDTAQETVAPGTSALTGVNTNVQVTTPTANPNCDSSEVDNGNNGAKYPWGGLNADGTDFTCNKCPTGLADL